jgi:hypothetical protein
LLRTRLAAPVVWLAVLTGCVPGTAVYDKPGVTYAEWRRDDAGCRQAAAGAADDGDAYARCMRERGYRLRPR